MKTLFLLLLATLAVRVAVQAQTPPPPPPVAEPPPPPPLPPKQETPSYVDEPAQFPGGPSALFSYLSTHLQYPPTAIEAGIQGKCYLRMIIHKDGSISDVTVQRGIPDCKECDQEAIRVVQAMPAWIPGKNKGKAVDSYFNMPVSFKLD